MAEVSGSLLLLKQWRCPFVLLRSVHEMPRHFDLQAFSAQEDLRSLCGLRCVAYEWLLCLAMRLPYWQGQLACMHQQVKTAEYLHAQDRGLARSASRS